MKLTLCILFIFMLFQVSGQDFDQALDPSSLESLNKVNQSKDSSIVKKPKEKSTGFFKLFTGTPGRAAFYSLIVPGGGQFYNRDYWKIPIVWGAEGTAIYTIFENTKNYKLFRDAYAHMLAGDIDNFLGLTNPSDVRLIRDGYRKNNEISWVVFAVLHILNVFEAFIDRHLMNFDVNEDLSYDHYNFGGGIPIYTFGSIQIGLNKQKKRTLHLIQP